MNEINIILIVLSLILLILILGLIFNRGFREDILKSDSQNEVGVKGINLKGSLFWVLYAATAGGAIYLGMKTQENILPPQSTPKPKLASQVGDFVAIDLEKLEPVDLAISCEGCDTLRLGRKPSRLNLDLSVGKSFEVMGRKSKYLFGRLDEESIKALSGFKQLTLQEYFEIKYDINLSPFKAVRDLSFQSDWPAYKSLPFLVEVKFDSEVGTYAAILPKEGTNVEAVTKNLNDKWSEAIKVGNDIYVVKLRASDLMPGGTPEFANFAVLEFEGK